MKVWKHTLRLADVFHNPAFTIEEKADKIRNRIVAARWFDVYDADLAACVEELADVTSARQFDEVWSELLAQFDDLGVWVETR